MDYPELLRKYIRLVGYSEGVHFIDPERPTWVPGISFTDEEWAELHRLAGAVSVQLEENGPITLMDEELLDRVDGILDNENEFTTWVEYRVKGGTERIVHRSVHVTLKKGLELIGEQGVFGG